MATVQSDVTIRLYFAVVRDGVSDLLMACDSDLLDEGIDAVMKPQNTVGLVAEIGYHVVGFAAWRAEEGERKTSDFRLLEFCVHPNHRRQGVGRKLLANIVSKAGAARRPTRLVADVPEEKLSAQLYLRNQGFIAREILPCVPEGMTQFEAKRDDRYRELYRMVLWPEWFTDLRICQDTLSH